MKKMRDTLICPNLGLFRPSKSLLKAMLGGKAFKTCSIMSHLYAQIAPKMDSNLRVVDCPTA